MAAAAAMSPFHFQRLFRATTGLTPHAYVMARRMEHARRMLNESDAKVAYVAARVGFFDLAHFRRAFRRQFNAAPRSMMGAGVEGWRTK
jgi:AraC family transcriptional regulator